MSKDSIKNPSVITRTECGTLSGYKKHLKEKEDSCVECRKVNNKASQQRREKIKLLPKTQPSFDFRCGTQRGFERHKRKREHPCSMCRDAHNLYRRCVPKEKMTEDEIRRKEAELLALYRISGKSRDQIRKREWLIQNRDKARMSAVRRRAIIAEVRSEPYTTQQILDTYGSDCHICHEPIDLDAPRRVGSGGWLKSLHLDHVVPLVRGGTDLIENIRTSHGICNLSKGPR
jgi:5-methylcytosine-specific restriction endonuclease McrA